MWASIVAPLALCLVVIVSTSCAGRAKPPRPHTGALPVTIEADWNDINAALSRSRLRTESIRLSSSVNGSGEAGSVVRHEMISIRDNHIWIEFETLEDWVQDGPPVPMRISVGSFVHEDESYERAVVGEIVRNLERLSGVGVARGAD